MEITWLQALLIALVAYAAVSTWTFGLGYFTLYRPLIGGTLVGLILGDAKSGMVFGAALNAVHLGFVSTGGTLPSDLAVAGYTGTALALSSGLGPDAALAAFGIPLGVLGGFLWFGRMTLGSALVHWADARAERGDTGGVAAINAWAGQGLLFLMYALPTFLIVFYGQRGVEQVTGLISERLLTALSVVGGMLPAVGIGLLLRSLARPRLFSYFIIGFLLAIYFELPIVVVALLGGAAAWLAVWGPREGREGATSWPAVDRSSAESDPEQSRRRVPRQVLWGAWWRWMMFLHASYNYERLQGLGFAHTMKPVIDHLYATTQERAAALKRHLTFFNSEPQFGALVPAAVVALEEEKASGAAITDETIHAVKSGLMGPLAGVGDSLIQGLITPLLLSLGISLAQGGNLAGPVLYVLLISPLILGTSYTFWSLGYRWGRRAVSRILSSGWVQALTDAAALTGMMVLGALTTNVVQFSTPVSVAIGPMAVSLQDDVLDPILRGLLPLSLTLAIWWLFSRRVRPLWVIAFVFVTGIDLTYLGLAGPAAPPLFTREWLAFVYGGSASLPAVLLHLAPPLVATGLAVIAFLVQRGGARLAR